MVKLFIKIIHYSYFFKVPQFKPEAGYYMFQRFIEQKPL